MSGLIKIQIPGKCLELKNEIRRYQRITTVNIDDLMVYSLGIAASVFLALLLYCMCVCSKSETDIKTLCSEVYKAKIHTDRINEVCNSVDVPFKDLNK